MRAQPTANKPRCDDYAYSVRCGSNFVDKDELVTSKTAGDMQADV